MEDKNSDRTTTNDSRILEKLLERNSLNRRLHWTTIASEKVLLALIGLLTLVASFQALNDMYLAGKVGLPDLFLLFIYVEIIGMIGAFYSTSRIPVTLPIIIAITALCRLIVMQSKESEALVLVAEASAILVLSCAAYLMSLKDRHSLMKLKESGDNKDT
ncbi:MAG: phosphate-starvation-inducible E-like protein [Gammaproteobacteria bacterium TMED92]|nr:MAG: phosphate-starvation-inducible E-like protein [Gammaproteobacteria bacterium TMED92]|tara:strand:- start:138 stop:617 length:480 start_codon:yes stop_codon:yes gene_type:complete